MREDKGKAGPFSQVFVAVAIALLVGGTAPWWWHEVKRLVTQIIGGGSEATVTNGPTPVFDPEKTVRKLLTAWNHRDRDIALKMAEGRAVDKLFSASSLKVNSKELTCYPAGTGQRDCQTPHTKGILVFRLIETDQGWWVERVEY